MSWWKWVLQFCDFVNFYFIWFTINAVVWKITLVPQYDLLQDRRCVFFGGMQPIFIGGHCLFFAWKPYLSLKKGIECKLFGGMFPLCPFSTYGLYYSTQNHGWFFRNNFTENEVLWIVLRVMLSANFPMLTFIWCWLILLWFQIKIREKKLGKGICLHKKQGFKLCLDVIFEWFY